VDEDDDDGDTALVGSLASRTGRGLGGETLRAGIPSESCSSFLTFRLSGAAFFGCFFRPPAGSASEAPERIGICSMDERGIQSSNSL